MIVITVPHAACLESNADHNCDELAPMVARIFSEEIHDVPFSMLLGNINRNVCDLNREESRDTDFRKMLRRYFEVEPGFLFDIHSFPADDPGEYEGVDVAIATNEADMEEYLCPLSDFLYSQGINNHVVAGITGDIIEEAKEYDIESYLFEFNEALSEDEIRPIVKAIVAYFVHE